MTTATLTPPPAPALTPYRFSVEDFHRMIETGIIREGDPVELLEGVVVRNMSQNPPHRSSVRRSARRIEALVGGWQVWSQAPVTLSQSEPLPDVVVARGTEADYEDHHPGPAEIGLLVEVSDSTLAFDSETKLQMYARDSIAEYWIVNIPDRQVEVYTQPSGPAATPTYAQRQVYSAGDSVPLTLDGIPLGQVAVDDLLP